LIGALIPLTLGYLFGASWEAVGNILAAISVLVAAFVIAVYLTVRLTRMMRRMKVIKEGSIYMRAGGEYIDDSVENPIIVDRAQKRSDFLPP